MRTVLTLALLLAGLVACSSAEPRVDAAAGCDGEATVRDAAGLQDALDAAEPGDVVALADGTYDGSFVATASGTADAPITLCGSAAATLDGGAVDSGYTLHLDGASYWRLEGFAVTGGQKGVMLDAASSNVLTGLRITDVGDEALHLRTGSSDNLVTGVRIRRTGLREPAFGEGVYVGSAESNWCDLTDCEPDRSDHNELVRNDVAATTAEAVDVKEGTTGGLLRDNDLGAPTTGEADSAVDVKGNGWVLRGNRIDARAGDGVQVHVVVEGWGQHTRVLANSFTLGDGYAVHVVGDAERSGTMVECAQRTAGSGAGEVTNVPCR